MSLLAAARSLPRGPAGHVGLRVSPAALRRLRRALGQHARMTAHVQVVAAGPTGRRTTLAPTYAVAR